MENVEILENRIKNLIAIQTESKSKLLDGIISECVEKTKESVDIILRLNNVFKNSLERVLQNEKEDIKHTFTIIENDNKLNKSYLELGSLSSLYNPNIEEKNKEYLSLQVRKSEATIGFFNAMFREVWNTQNELLFQKILMDNLECFRDEGYNQRLEIGIETAAKIFVPIVENVVSVFKTAKKFKKSFDPTYVRKQAIESSSVLFEYLDNYDYLINYWITINKTFINEFEKIQIEHQSERNRIVENYNKKISE